MVKDDVFLDADVWFLVFEDDELLFSHAARKISINSSFTCNCASPDNVSMPDVPASLSRNVTSGNRAHPGRVLRILLARFDSHIRSPPVAFSVHLDNPLYVANVLVKGSLCCTIRAKSLSSWLC
jgi:hypothetical protein